MKLGVIGIGDIAKKAYLPYTTTLKGIELYLFTRHRDTLKEIKSIYPSVHIVDDIDQMTTCCDAVMIHAATHAHADYIKKFLNKGIPVFVDKPISLEFNDVEALFTLAKEKNVLFRTGFNRIYTPRLLKAKKDYGYPDVIVYQKNRHYWPSDLKDFIYNDFIHVLDTALFFIKDPIEDFMVQKKEQEGLCVSLSVFLKTKTQTAHLLMYRHNGISEEIVDLYYPNYKLHLENLDVQIEAKDNMIQLTKYDDWTPMLKKRGFEDMIDAFIHDVKMNSEFLARDLTSYHTHTWCEKIYQELK